MKDAKGHGSNSRGAFGQREAQQFKTGSLRGVGIAEGAKFSPRYTNTQHTIESMRAQMRNTGPGHRAGLLQGIRNLLGG